MRMIELQEKFASELASSVKANWDRIQLHYENMTINGASSEIFSAFYYRNAEKTQFNLAIELLDVLVELNRNQPLGQGEKWTWFEFEIDNSGKYKFDYKYGIPPFIATKLKYSDSSNLLNSAEP